MPAPRVRLTTLRRPLLAPSTSAPASAADTGCQFLIILNADGTDDDRVKIRRIGPFDGNDDTLVGVVNNSGAPCRRSVSAPTRTSSASTVTASVARPRTRMHYTWTGTGLNGGGYSASAGFPVARTGPRPDTKVRGFRSATIRVRINYETGNVNFSVPDGSRSSPGLPWCNDVLQP